MPGKWVNVCVLCESLKVLTERFHCVTFIIIRLDDSSLPDGTNPSPESLLNDKPRRISYLNKMLTNMERISQNKNESCGFEVQEI